MANEQHLAILRQGVEIWNDWTIKTPVSPDLSGANLSGANLSGVDFSGANLSEANLSEANLSEANLSEANLSEANLSWADLSKTNLNGADLSWANLSGADFSGADFNGADLSRADLSRANLSGVDLSKANLSKANLGWANLSEAYLSGADLSGADLSGADLSGVDLSGVDLSGVDLSGADLSGADLSGVDLSRVDLSGVDLSGADLSGLNISELDFSGVNLMKANLIRIQALKTNFTFANFTGACIEDWNTNSATNLTNVICDYIYLRQGQQERRPSSGNFAPGEFTKLYQKSLETIDLIFRNGIDWDAFAYSFKKIEVENQGAQLDVQSIEKKGDGVLLVRISVSPEANKANIHYGIMQTYELAIKALEEERKAKDKLIASQEVQIVRYEGQINRLMDIVEQQGSVQKALAENPRKVSNYDLRYSQLAGGIVDADTVQSQQIGGTIQNTDNQRKPD